MLNRWQIAWIFLGGFIVAVSVMLRPATPALAAGPPDDYACRGCHGNNTQELTLPSGETLPLLAPLDAINSSPHHSSAETPVSCVACHQSRARYQYPHQPNPAQTRREFVLEVSANCQDCHFPHRPLHNNLAVMEDELPVCVDCHGSHQIDRVDDMLNSLPAACLACHADQTPDWAADFVAPRPGLGQGAEGYVGSDHCAGCHEDKYFTWRETLHAGMVQDAVADPAVIMGNFNSADSDLTFGREEVLYAIGSRWKQQYLTRDEAGKFLILPAQWNIAQRDWVAYNADTWQTIEWQQACGSCHVTGLDTQTGEFAEFGLGCESCHGPGAAHIANPKQVKPFARIDDQVCGACHSRGVSPDGLPFPATYRPGDTLTDHFTFTTADSDVWPDGSARKNHQQYQDWQLGNSMAAVINCTACHAVHDNGVAPAQVRLPLNDLCVQCHNDKKAIIAHTPYHDKAIGENSFTCADCHLPKMATSAAPYDIRNHSFSQPNPQGTLDHGGLENMLNACNVCHADVGETPQWAVNTISYAQRAVTPVPASVFGPGSTPTSPLPPTPLPSVGQKADVAKVQVETGRWLRNIVFAIAGLLALGMVFLVYRYFKTRGVDNAAMD
jgi:predicted CXXCH cytochrome family protein